MRTALTTLALFASTPALAANVVTDILPVAALVSLVQKDLGTATALSRGGDAHHVQLRPSEARALAEADLLVSIGPRLSPWFDEAAEGLAPDAPRVSLLAVEGTIARETMFGGHSHDEDYVHRDEGHDDHDHGHDDHDHDHADHDDEDAHTDAGDGDAHAWLDPMNAMAWLPAIADALASADPDNASAYQANAEAGIAALETLVWEMRGTFDDADLPPMLVQHDAYAHLVARYELPIVDTIADSEAVGPGGASVSALDARIASGDIGCILTEAGIPDRLAQRLSDRRIPIVQVDPLGLAQGTGPDAYAGMMRALAADIARCGG